MKTNWYLISIQFQLEHNQQKSRLDAPSMIRDSRDFHIQCNSNGTWWWNYCRASSWNSMSNGYPSESSKRSSSKHLYTSKMPSKYKESQRLSEAHQSRVFKEITENQENSKLHSVPKIFSFWYSIPRQIKIPQNAALTFPKSIDGAAKLPHFGTNERTHTKNQSRNSTGDPGREHTDEPTPSREQENAVSGNILNGAWGGKAARNSSEEAKTRRTSGWKWENAIENQKFPRTIIRCSTNLFVSSLIWPLIFFSPSIGIQEARIQYVVSTSLRDSDRLSGYQNYILCFPSNVQLENSESRQRHAVWHAIP